MGEQTQTQQQTDSKPQIENPPQPQPNPVNHDSSATTTELTTVAAPQIPPSKITPSRPRKIRKVSPDQGIPQTNPKTQKTTATRSTKPTKPSSVQPLRVVSRSLSYEGEVENAIRHLRNADPLLSPLIDLHPLPTFDAFHTPFLALTKSILYQQLAFKAGASIYTRFIALCGGESGVVPESVLSLTPQQLRQIGVSGRKASYLHDLARKYQNGILSDSSILNMDDKSLFTMLTMVNGIGSWSVHMFMIFSLQRPDVLPVSDLGVRKGVQLLYNLEELPRPSQMEHLCEKWRPYRSVASWYMWRMAESKGPPSSAVAVAAGLGMMQPRQHLQGLEEVDQQHHQQQQEPPLLDPINSILNLGACAWGQ